MSISRDNQSFVLALVVIIGGGLLLRFPPSNASADPAQFTILFGFVSGSIGTVLGFFFANRSASSAVEAAAAAAPNQTVNATPATGAVNVNPPAAPAPDISGADDLAPIGDDI